MGSEVYYSFVNYGEDITPVPGALTVDVGLKTVPGVIDHHFPGAEAECAASLVVKHPELVLDHLKDWHAAGKPIEITTHRFPDFDAISAIFLALTLLEKGQTDKVMTWLADYARMVDSSSLPKTIDLTATPYSILRAIFAGLKGSDQEINRQRLSEGLELMKFICNQVSQGEEMLENRLVFRASNRYEKMVTRCEEDYFDYLDDIDHSEKISLELPLTTGTGTKQVDGLIVKNPKSFLLKDWARRDFSNSRLRSGFSFILTFFGMKRVIMGVDIEAGVNLKGLAEVLNEKEKEKRLKAGYPVVNWYDGNCPLFNFRIIDSPQNMTFLSDQEIRSILFEFGHASDKLSS